MENEQEHVALLHLTLYAAFENAVKASSDIHITCQNNRTDVRLHSVSNGNSSEPLSYEAKGLLTYCVGRTFILNSIKSKSERGVLILCTTCAFRDIPAACPIPKRQSVLCVSNTWPIHAVSLKCYRFMSGLAQLQ